MLPSSMPREISTSTTYPEQPGYLRLFIARKIVHLEPLTVQILFGRDAREGSMDQKALSIAVVFLFSGQFEFRGRGWRST